MSTNTANAAVAASGLRTERQAMKVVEDTDHTKKAYPQARATHTAKSQSWLLQKTAAEGLGTFALVFFGCGAVAVNEVSGGAVGHLGISLAFGLVVCAVIYATGHLSGAHINPAVTVAFASLGAFPWRRVPAYLLAQCAGATAAAATILVLLSPTPAATATTAVAATPPNLGVTHPAFGFTAGQAFGLEFLLTAVLMFVVTAVATDSRAVGPHAGLVIGATVTLEALVAGPICGASMNPARSLGPAIIAGQLQYLWVYLGAPMLGAWAGAQGYRALRCTHLQEQVSGCR